MKKQACLFLPFVILTLALTAPAQSDQAGAVRVKVTAEQANLRERPDIGSGVVQQIPEGTVLLADRKEGEWYLVRFTLEDGGVIAGYIHESLVVVTTQEPGAPVSETREPVTKAAAAPRPKPATPKPAEPVSRPFEFSVSFLGGTVDPNDLNDGTQGIIDHYGAFLGLEPSGAADAVGLAFGLGLELSYRISPELAIGADIVHLRGGTTSTVVYAGEGFSESLTVEPAFQALPININVRFYPGRGFYLKGGLGAYHVKAGYLYKFADDEGWRQSKGSATAWTLGAEAAFGGDWKVGQNLVFFAEAGFRLARWSGLDGQDVYSDSLDGNLVEEGTLYYWKQSMDPSSYPFLFVRAGRPEGAGVSFVRAADINLSGTSLRAGLRFRF
ncbi:MAG: hypothetical protein R6X21_12140 [Candidatus Aminicenantes bacterium]